MSHKSAFKLGISEILQLKLRCSQFPGEIVPISDLASKAGKHTIEKTAAVLIPLCNFKGVPSILFTLRSVNVGTHKGQVSFPGGHMNHGETAVDAAIREAYEELGSNIGDIEILAQCQTLPAITGTMVTPILGYLKKEFVDYDAFEPDVHEVDRVFFRTIDQLLEPGYCTYETFERNGKRATLPVFGCNEKEERIWGLTAVILKGILDNAITPARLS